ncbi:MlaD family protein [Gordonia sp. (in: high G+C Gram-positive bacteria)]|uniref:MlaD family protein n=1 Tax=Gordonia sp. (in: high G+C Gram-positive bacteria) TaxID=84139 RepID=UPI001D2AB756|nr:MlaD family protein [Gordonia sp. (in: high G+C Gram-positive bacteria)]MCB1297289.1 MCE family protein [Gordonia sp. (in: high G+C Gram-positive bacteria)]HMS77585.1 MlaD family protein [Gordonia sp. (in: high G+C Gram-positive bacteria)]HQV18253.1 MlaD family protein [Gordonia sp. (in: high G+C Gram-positive bacteria)]
MSRAAMVTASGMRTGLSVVAMLALMAVSILYLGSVGLSVTDNRGVRTAKLELRETNGLVVGSRVLYRGVPVGKVTKVQPSVTGVDVSWNYKKEYVIPEDSRFRVDNLSALGETYLGITPRGGGGPALSDGVRLATSSVEVPTTIDELSARFTRLLEQVNEKKVRAIIDEANTGLVPDRELLGNIANASALLESTIITTRGSLTELLDRFQPLLIKGADVSDELAASGKPLARFADGLALFVTEGGKSKPTSRDGKDGFIVSTHAPDSLNNQAKPLLTNIQRFLDRSAPDLKILGEAVTPAISETAAQLRTVDLSDLMRTALATAGNGNGLVVKVSG